MKRKMHAFALTGKCTTRGARGLAPGSSAAAAFRAKKPSPSSNDVSASPVKPAPNSQRNCRREPMHCGCGLVDIDKLIQVEHPDAQAAQRGLFRMRVSGQPALFA